MKTTFYIIGLLAFSAVMLSPALPAKYPSKKVARQKIEMIEKEKKLNEVIKLVEYNLKVNKVLLENKSSKNKEH